MFTDRNSVYPPGNEANSVVADPKFATMEQDSAAANRYEPQSGSPLIDAGVALPGD